MKLFMHLPLGSTVKQNWVLCYSENVVAIGPALLFQTGSCFIQVILHSISTTGTNGHNKFECSTVSLQYMQI